MIIGIGMDLCEISRMEKLLSDGRFLARFFSAEEQAYIQSKGKNAAQSMAGIFAAKEALAKALGTGITSGALADICILHDEHGAPYYDLCGSYAEIAKKRQINALFLSITHEAGIAAAMCVAERKD